MRLPVTGWNGRLARIDGQFAHLGCFGAECGGPVSAKGCDQMVRRGYVCFVSDTGDQVPADRLAWAARGVNGRTDFAYRATHLATLAAKGVVRRFYGRSARRSYFLGCAIGGRQGLIEAQQFPKDYDGIVAGAPVTRYVDNRATLEWNARALLDPRGRTLFPAPGGVGYLQGDFRLLHTAIMARCDRLDGVADDILADPRRCSFDPAELACRGAKTPTCLSAAQIAAIHKIFTGPGNGLRAWPGSEVNWGYSYMAPDGGSAVADRLKSEIASVGGAGSTQFDATDADLSAFRQAGGKIMLFQGWSDHEVLPEGVIGYRENVVRAMGGEMPTQAFLRLFMIPAMDHCGNGASADKIDYVGAIESWVERGTAPDVLIASRITDLRLWPGDPGYWGSPPWPAARIAFARPVYPYPQVAAYVGHGDTDDPVNFLPATTAP